MVVGRRFRCACTAVLLSLSLSGGHSSSLRAVGPDGGRKGLGGGRFPLMPRSSPHHTDAASIVDGTEIDERQRQVVGLGQLMTSASAVMGKEETHLQRQTQFRSAAGGTSILDSSHHLSHGTTSRLRLLPRTNLNVRWMRDTLFAAGRVRLRNSAAMHLRGGGGGEGRKTTAGGVVGQVAVRGGGTASTAGGAGASPRANAVEGLKNGLASGLAAACVKTVLQPFDTMKTVQQFSTTRVTLLQAGRDLVARGGVRELYQGLGVTLVGSMPAVGIYFGLYQFVKKQMDAVDNMSPYLSITVSAGVGNFIASFFRVPYEVVKQRLQVGAYPNTMVALQSIYQQGGLWGFFGKGGLQTQWARDIPYAMITLLVYETLQKAAARRKGPGEAKKATPLENMVIGAIAGGIGSLATNPMDMIKTRMMTAPELYAGPIDAAWMALSKEGPQAFMKGATPRLLHKIPANAFFFVAYEFFRNALGVTR